MTDREPIHNTAGQQPSNKYAVDFGDETMQSAVVQPWNRHAADLSPASFDSLRAEVERYRRNPLNLTTEQLEEIRRTSEDLV